MIPIDGEKLIEWLQLRKKRTIKENPCNEYSYDCGEKNIIKDLLYLLEIDSKGDFNLPPGTLVIQREEGYEKRGCESCISLYHGEIHSEPDCKIIRDSSRVYDDWVDGTKHEPCQYHVTESELKAAYIVGGGEK